MMNNIEAKEDAFYTEFLDKALDYARGVNNVDGIQVRQLIAAAGVVAKQRQTRGAMKALCYQVERDRKSGLLPDAFRLENKTT